MSIAFIVMLAFLALMVLGGLKMGLVRMIFNVISFVISNVVALLITLMLASGFKFGNTGIVVTFLITFVLSFVVLLVVSLSLSIINSVPVVSSVNNILGAILGAVFAILIIWTFMAIIGAMPASEFTTNVLSSIEANPITKALYENNIVQIMLDKLLWSNLDVKIKSIKEVTKLKAKFKIK